MFIAKGSKEQIPILGTKQNFRILKRDEMPQR